MRYCFLFFIFLFSSLVFSFLGADTWCTNKRILQLQKEVESFPSLLKQEQRHAMFGFVNTLKASILPEIINSPVATLQTECERILLLEWTETLEALSNNPDASIMQFVVTSCNILGLVQYHIKVKQISKSIESHVQK
jgi:hypothetical protein